MVADVKFSQFTVGNEMMVGDEPVGLRPTSPTENFIFNFPGAGIKDSSGNYLFEYESPGALAVNHLKLISSLTGEPVVITAAGTDTDISISILPIGTGALYLDNLKWPTSDGTAGQFITTDGAGNLSFTSGGGGGSTDIIGTANQVLANGTSGVPQSGTVTLTLPQDIATTSSPTFDAPIFTAPVLGTPASGNLVNCTGAVVAGGGTGVSSFTAYAVICGGTTSTGALQSVASVGTSSQVLTSNGAGALPTWQTPGALSGGLLNVQVFTSSGTYTPTVGMSNCIVQCWGAGGGGGGGAGIASFSNGGGGGAGSFSQSYVSAATIGASQTVTVGSGGGGGVGASNGGNGNNTSVGTIVIANGGSGGALGSNSAGAGGLGGTAGTGDIIFPGTAGFSALDTFSADGGQGAPSTLGGSPIATSANSNGASASANTGSGGSGACGSGTGAKTGGNGGSGFVIVYEYR